MLAKLSVKKPLTIIVAVVLIVLLAVISFMNMQTDLLPKLDLPYVAVITAYPGASPEKVEGSVTKPLENTLATIGGIEKITSISSENSSTVILQFGYSINMDTAIIEMSNKLDMVSAQMEDGVATPILMKIDPNLLPVMVASVDMGDTNIKETSAFVSETVIPAFEKINGVASVSSTGLISERVSVTLNQDKIDELNDKVLVAVDEQLVDAKKQLDKAKKEIESQKSKLSPQANEMLKELNQAMIQLFDGKAQAQIGLNSITTATIQLKQQLTQLQTTEKILTTVVEEAENILADLTKVINESNNALKALDVTEKQLIAQREELLKNPTPENLAKVAEIEVGLQRIKAERTILEQTVSVATQFRTEIRNIMRDPSNNDGDSIYEMLDQMQEGIQACEDALGELPEQQLTVEDLLEDLGEKQTQLLEGKDQITMGLTEATVQLAMAEKELNEKTAEFEASRDAAFEKANLNGMITQDMVSNILMAENFSMPAGYLQSGNVDTIVKVGEKFASIDELKKLELFEIDAEDVGTICLEDVADISVVDNIGETYAKINGNDGILLSFQKQSTASTSEISDTIRKTMDMLEEEHEGLHITPLNDQGVYINIVVNSVISNLLMGGILAIVILFLFLRNIKPTLIVAMSIPISLMLAVVLMYFSNVTLNLISLCGLALGVGMLVDNSIVVIENIYRLRALGMSAAKAAVKGAMQVGGAITASTLTTVCVFLPIVFTEGLSRQLFTDMGLTIGYSLVASLLIAMTLVPTLSSTMLTNIQQKPQKRFDAFVNWYGRLLEKVLKHKAWVLSGAAALLIISGIGAATMGTAFIPESDTSEISVSLEMSNEASTEELRETTDKVAEIVGSIDGVATVGAMEGSSGNSMSLYVLLEEKRKLSSLEICQEITDKTTDLPCEISASGSGMDMSAMSGSGIAVNIFGDDMDMLQDLAVQIGGIISEVEGTVDIDDGTGEASKETRIVIDKNKAMSYGLTVAQVYQEIAKALKTEITSTTLSIGDKEYPVVVATDKENQLTEETLKSHTISGQKNGEAKEVSLSEIASFDKADALDSIHHDNSKRYITVSAGIDAEHNIGLVSRELTKKLDKFELPEGYSMTIGGENETINNSLRDLILMVLLAIVFIYLIMVAQFQSLLSPFIVMFTIPLAFTGGLLMLWFTGGEISMIAMLGFLVLAGVVVNNGIVFVDYTNQLRAEGLSLIEALVETGKRRIRPILMTALTTILGLFTLALGIGTGTDMLQPMAIVIIGGLTYSTLLTLFVVPSLYSILQRKPLKVINVDDIDATEEKHENA